MFKIKLNMHKQKLEWWLPRRDVWLGEKQFKEHRAAVMEDNYFTLES